MYLDDYSPQRRRDRRDRAEKSLTRALLAFLLTPRQVAYSQPSFGKGTMPAKQSYNIVALPGDGIGPEVLSCALKVLHTAGQLFQIDFQVEEIPCGGHYYAEHETEWPA